jgi:RNA polymerase sigma-70 factor (ECF subfamily)
MNDRLHDEPDPATVAAATSGDVDAFATLVHFYQGPVWRYLQRLVGDASVAEDLTQEVFVRVFQRLDTFAGRARFSTWVFGIARNAGIDALRRRDRRPRVVADVPADLAGDTGPARRVELGAALEELSVVQRDALLLVEVFGLSYREVADMTGTAEGTIKSRVHGARRRLHSWWHAGEPHDDV